MAYRDKLPVYLISSSESDEEMSEFSKNKILRRTVSQADDYGEILPLRERLQRAKNLAQTEDKANVRNLPDEEVTFIEDKQNAFVNEVPKSDNICKPSTSSYSPKTYKFTRNSSDNESLPDLETNFYEEDQFQDNILPGFGDENKSHAKDSKRTKKSKEEILEAKEQKLKEREEKLKIREKQLQIKEQEKKMKELRKQEQKSIKPGECIKNVTVMIDLNLMEIPEASMISKELDQSQMNYSLIEQFIPNSLTWSRKAFSQNLDEIQVSQETVEENQLVLIIPAIKFLKAVNYYKLGNCKSDSNSDSKDLLTIYRETKELYPTKRITIITTGVEKYFSAQKSKEQRAYRQNVLNEDNSQTNNGPKRKRDDNKLGFSVTRLEVEEALIDLQLREFCSIYILPNADEVGRLVVGITKSIAESQFKLGKIDYEMAWLMNADTKDSVKVDKNGSGMQLLWQKQLQQLNLVSVDTAQAIIAQYPTPSSLIKAYKRCLNDQQRQQLLQDILVRRGIGPLSSTRRIGPELSRKIFVLFTSKNGNEMLDAYQC